MRQLVKNNVSKFDIKKIFEYFLLGNYKIENQTKKRKTKRILERFSENLERYK